MPRPPASLAFAASPIWAAARDSLQPRLARPGFGVSHVMAYGQSLSSGWDGVPALSTTPDPRALMLGGSVRPQHDLAAEWRVVGAPILQNLAATNQDVTTGRFLSPAEAASLPPDQPGMGETVLEAATKYLQRLQSGTRFLASSCGVGGRTLEQLSRGADPELFNRLRDCARAARKAVETAGFDYGIAALLMLQGEHNSWGVNGGTTDPAAYVRLFIDFYRDFLTEIVAGIAGQAAPPAVFTYQTGGTYASEDQAIPQAQLDAAMLLPGCFMVGPSYPVPAGERGHLSADGYRWLGAQFGKVMHKVLNLGEAWRPLHPLLLTLRGTDMRIWFHVPVPPLVWGRPFTGLSRATIADGGFTVLDAEGIVPLAAVELAGPDEVKLTLARPIAGLAHVIYAARRHGGRGGLCDSDPSLADDVFAGPEGDDLAGQPYPLSNWCVAFRMVLPPAEPAP